MSKPRVSIVIAAFKPNLDHFVDALSSALSQTYQSIEILVNDDSPKDELHSLVIGYNDSRLKYLHNNPALGTACNHWQAFSRAKGDYIAILNHDDLLSPTFIENLVYHLDNNPECVLAFCDHWIINGNGTRDVHKTNSNSAFYGRYDLPEGICSSFTQLLLSQSIPLAMGSVFRSSSLPQNYPIAGPAYDLWLTYLLAKTGGFAYYLPERLSSWRNHEDNTTSAGGIAWLEDSANCWLSVSKDPAFQGSRSKIRSKCARSLLACSMREWKNNRRIKSFKYALRSLLFRINLKTVILLFAIICPYTLISNIVSIFKLTNSPRRTT